jgi:small subunit ribosomal protein S18
MAPAPPARSKKSAGVRSGSCRFCREKPNGVDYKDIATLQKMLSAQGRMLPRKRTGLCAKCQRGVAAAVKRARFLALLPFVS